VIEALQAEAGPDGIMNRQVSLHVGETVRILQGPFTDLPGRLERLDAAGRVCVLLDLLGRSVRVDLSRDAVSPAA
jgi:transcription antitermination factor NusG